jgi:putative glycerol-1-phosphate prenyltransferase
MQTAQAGALLGKKLIYLEAGSGAQKSVPLEMIALVSKNISIPLIVGGGIKKIREIKLAHQAGADIVVIGTAFEENPDFFN